jgi:hypothetical protein
MLSETDHATLRTFNGKLRLCFPRLTKDCAFRPSKVIAALRWLKENNWLYRDIVIEVPAEWLDEESGELIDDDISGPTIDLTEEETKELDIADHTNHSGHDAGGTALEILQVLMNSIDADISPTMEVLKLELEEPEALDDGTAVVYGLENKFMPLPLREKSTLYNNYLRINWTYDQMTSRYL